MGLFQLAKFDSRLHSQFASLKLQRVYNCEWSCGDAGWFSFLRGQRYSEDSPLKIKWPIGTLIGHFRVKPRILKS
jgi:hypothetical protein